MSDQDPIRYNTITMQVGAAPDLEICLLVVRTAEGPILHLALSGEALLALPTEIEKLRAKLPALAGWKSAPRH